MPQQLLLEGADLEALIRRAREEYGPGARVVRAEKVRTGGFLGFFTQEHFELTVELSDAEIARAAATRAPVEVVTSRAQLDAALADEIADAQAARDAMFAGTLDAPTAPGAARGQEPAPQQSLRTDSGIAAPATEMSAPRDVVEFDRLVVRLTEQAAAAAGPQTAATPKTTGAPRATAATQAPSAPTSAHAPSAMRAFVPATFPVAERPAPVAASPETTPTVGIAGFHEDSAGADGGLETASTRTMTRPSGGGGEGVPFEPGEPSADGSEDLSTHASGAQRFEGVVLHRWGVYTDVAAAVTTHCTVPALLSLGVPMRCVEDYADLGSPVPLLDVVARFGTPPVRRPEPGDLIVVAGPAEDALAVASQLAAWVGLPRTAVALAGESDAIRGHGRRVRDEAQASALRARAEKAGRLGEPLIVALGVAPGRRGAASSAPLLAAFDADTVWAVIDATKRPATYEPSIALLAADSRIDALAAVNVSDAQAPCAMLDASLPVAWMDGLPAAGLVWAALLGERIAALD